MNGNRTDASGYLDIDEWRKAIQNSRLHYEAELKKSEEQMQTIELERDSFRTELDRINAEEKLMLQTIHAYEDRMEQNSKRSPLQGRSLRETLIIHFTDPNGVIIGRNASKALVEIGYFNYRHSADSAIYSALAKQPFQKIEKGVYRIPTNSTLWTSLRQAQDTNIMILETKDSSKSLLLDKVKIIRNERPNVTVSEVSKELQMQGWDFKGKNPNLVISGIFMNMNKDRSKPANSNS